MISTACDVCDQPIETRAKVTRADVKAPSGKHLATVALTMNTRSGQEHVCLSCQLAAITEAVRGHK